MNDIILWAGLTDLAPVIAALTDPEPEWMCLERVPSAWLTKDEIQWGLRLEAFHPGENWNSWERGRLFGPAFELRWEKQDGIFRAVYIGASRAIPGFSSGELDLGEFTDRSYLLWGNRVPDEQLADVGADLPAGQTAFLEFVTPRLLYYPLNVERVALHIREYTDLQNGALLYYRFVGLEAANESV